MKKICTRLELVKTSRITVCDDTLVKQLCRNSAARQRFAGDGEPKLRQRDLAARGAVVPE